LARLSLRRTRFVPIRVKAAGSLSAGLSGGFTLPASATRSPKPADLPDFAWLTRLSLTVISAGGTFHFAAAAWTNIARVAAPALRSCPSCWRWPTSRRSPAPHHRVGVDLGVGRGEFDADPGPVGVQLLGDDGGEAGVAALAELDVLADHRHRAVGGHLDEGTEGPDRRLGAGAEQVGRRTADQQGAADHGNADHQVAAGGLNRLAVRVHA